MYKFIIGLSAQEHEIQIAGFIASRLAVASMSMQQPINDAVAEIIGFDHVAASHCPQNIRPCNGFDATLSELKAIVAEGINHIAPGLLVALLKDKMQKANSRNINRHLHEGTLMYGIQTADEAQAVRDMGGIMLFVRNNTNPPKPHPDDIVINNWQGDKKQYEYIADVLRAYRDAKAA